MNKSLLPMTETPLVSIVLCTYNGEKYLRQQLDTLITQTYQNVEIIAVDDCSADSTYDILQQYAALYPQFLVYKNARNVGFAKNFEIAFGYSKGKFIAFCDQDDLWHPEKIELQVKAIGNNQLIYHDSEFIDEDGQRFSYYNSDVVNEEGSHYNYKMSDVYNFYKGNDPEVFLLENCVSGHAIMAQRDLLKQALPFDKELYHDWWLSYVAVNIGTIDFIPKCLVKYRRHAESSTIKDRKDATKGQKLRQDIKWIAHCVKFKANKNPEFVKRLYSLYSGYTSHFVSLRLWWLLKQNANKLFYLTKRSRISQQRDVNRFIWGVKARDFWYKHVKNKPEKVFNI
jgi:glycosyltransferase involved in cell wall biosynthesis